MFLTRLAKWLKGNRVDTITGKLPFDGPHNNGYWRIMGCNYQKTVSVDEWR